MHSNLFVSKIILNNFRSHQNFTINTNCKNIVLYGYNSEDFDGQDYKKIMKLENKNQLNKDLIKPYYSS